MNFQTRYNSYFSEMQFIVSRAERERRDLTEKEAKRFSLIKKRMDALKKKLASATSLSNAQSALASYNPIPVPMQSTSLIPASYARSNPADFNFAAPSGSAGKIFKGNPQQRRAKAYAFGLFWAIQISKGAARQKYHNILQNLGFTFAATPVGTAAPSAMFPTELIPEFISLVAEHGAVRKHLDFKPISSLTAIQPVLIGEPVVSFPGSTTPVVSDGFNALFADKNHQLKEATAAVDYPKVLDEVAIMNIGDVITESFARALARTEDKSALVGDGTSTYSGMKGLVNTIGAAGKVSTAAGHNTYATITVPDIFKFFGRLPKQFKASEDVVIYTSPAAKEEVFDRLKAEAGGNDLILLSGGSPDSFYGKKIEEVIDFPSNTGTLSTGDVIAILANSNKAMGAAELSSGPVFDEFRETLAKERKVLLMATHYFDIQSLYVGDASTVGAAVALVSV